MDQPATPARYLACNREGAPMRRGRPRKTRRASMRRGPTTYLRLSHGRLEAGPGGGPASCCLEISPFMGRRGPPARHTMGQRRPDALAAETDGRAKYGAAHGPPFSFPQKRVGAARLHLSSSSSPEKARETARTPARRTPGSRRRVRSATRRRCRRYGPWPKERTRRRSER